MLLTILVFAFGARAQQQPLEPEATFDDWAKACEEIPQGGRKCFVFQNVTTQDGTRPIVTLTVLKVPEAARPILLLTVPLGVFLPQGLGMSIDGNEPLRIPLQICSPNGCQSQFEFPDKLLGAFKAGNNGTVKMFDPGGKEVNVPFSLKGFTKALASIS
ncbi:MAG: invasion associated locus B family protein [Alphaproteobacteria bacterium]|nr:invasion associated locus B family protein [Alphaproteobacteria bacterium]